MDHRMVADLPGYPPPPCLPGNLIMLAAAVVSLRSPLEAIGAQAQDVYGEVAAYHLNRGTFHEGQQDIWKLLTRFRAPPSLKIWDKNETSVCIQELLVLAKQR